MGNDSFDLEKVREHFNRSLKDDDDVLMDAYLEGFREVNKFCQLMGTVFGFISSDIKAKIEILEEFRKKDTADEFESFKIMLQYEQHSGLLLKSDYVSGSRTLLRLHRGLEFLSEFLSRISKIGPNEKTSAVGQNTYNDTLSKFHPWIVRKGAIVAMYALPTREVLLRKTGMDPDKALEVLPDMLAVTKTVYDRTEQLYHNFDLHSLP